MANNIWEIMVILNRHLADLIAENTRITNESALTRQENERLKRELVQYKKSYRIQEEQGTLAAENTTMTRHGIDDNPNRRSLGRGTKFTL